MNFCWILTCTNKHHIKSIQYPSQKCPEKPCPDCLKILIMSWLFKDPIVTVAWLNFDHANSKKWSKKIKLPQMNFFLEKQLIKFSCTYKHLSWYKIKKKFSEMIQSYEDVLFLAQNCPYALNKVILVRTISITLIYLLALFIKQNFKKVLRANWELWYCTMFRPKIIHLVQTNFF